MFVLVNKYMRKYTNVSANVCLVCLSSCLWIGWRIRVYMVHVSVGHLMGDGGGGCCCCYSCCYCCLLLLLLYLLLLLVGAVAVLNPACHLIFPKPRPPELFRGINHYVKTCGI